MERTYIYLVFTKTNTWLSRIIGAVSQIEYPHASLSLDDSFTRMYSFGRVNPDNPFSGGFAEENLFEGVFQKSSGCRCLIYRVPVNKAQYIAVQSNIHQFWKNKEEYGYNFIGLLGVWFNKPIKRKKHYFCSQFVSEILIRGQISEAKLVPELTRTDDLLALKSKELVYEGPVTQYNIIPQQYVS